MCAELDVRFNFRSAVLGTPKLVWQCVQFWTPLTATYILLWLLYRPSHFRPHVDSAVLTDLRLTNDSVLRYNLSADLSFRNTHRRLGLWYLDVGATAFYGAVKLGASDDSLPSFYQPHKNTTLLHPTFRSAVAVQDPLPVALLLSDERTAGALHLRVRVSLTLMYKVVVAKSVVFYAYDCWLWFPPMSPKNAMPALFHADDRRPNCWRAK